MKTIFLIFVFSLFTAFSNITAQDSTKSNAFKTNRPKSKYPLIKSKYPSYQLLTGFLLFKEAQKGDPYAQHELAIRYLTGKGFKSDTTSAIYWLKLAVEQNLPYAIFNYGIIYNNGIGVEWNPFEAYKYFKSAAESGLPAGQYAYGIFFTDNLVINRNYKKAYKYVKLAADGGFEHAVKALEQFKKSGFKFALDSTETVSKINTTNDGAELIEQNWELDFFEFENDSLTEEEEVEKIKKVLNQNTEKLKESFGISEELLKISLKDTSATELIKYASNSGSPEALLLSGRGFEKGIVVKKDVIKATANYLRSLRLGSRKASEYLYNLTRSKGFFENLKREVDKNNPDAMYVWAGLVALNFDYSITSEQAFNLLEKAVKQNHILSIVETGLCFYNGNLVNQNKDKAKEYWLKASKLGSLEAKVRIAFSKISELKENDNLTEEIDILKDASARGSVLAQSAIAYCYEKGIGLKKNKPEAVQLYRKAASRGNITAYNSLKRIYDEMRPKSDEFEIYEE